MRPEQFATEQHPLRASALTQLFVCAGSKVGDMLSDLDDAGGKAAQTGTAVGRACEVYHSTDLDFGSIMDQVKKESKEAKRPFDGADWGEVERMFKSYTLDSRNPRSAVLPESLEEEVVLRLDPHPFDPTGEQIVIPGHLDQVRFENGTYMIWDIKSGKPEGYDMVEDYAYQQVAYAEAYAQKYPERRVAWGGIIRLRDYLTPKRVKIANWDPKIHGKRKTRDVENPIEDAKLFYPTRIPKKHYGRILDQIRAKVAMVRAGLTDINPTSFCRLCIYENVDKCTYWLRKKGFAV